MPSHAFVLGTERSGSTWLANILDAHPRVELLMEPFADYADIFPGFPHRGVHLDSPDPALARGVHEIFPRLIQFKYPFFYKRGRGERAYQLDVVATRLLSRLRGLGVDARLAAARFEALNLNRSGNPLAATFRKDKSPHVYAVKELRLNLKVNVLRAAFPEACFVVTLRHPGAQITSILKWFERNRLVELRRSLSTLHEDVARQPGLSAFRSVVAENARSGDLSALLVAWWFLQNCVLLADLVRCGGPYRIARHEELSEDPPGVVSGLLAFLGLEPSPQVQDYLARSSSEKGTPSPIDTRRDSRRFYRDAIQGAPAALDRRIEATAAGLAHDGALSGALLDYVRTWYRVN